MHGNVWEWCADTWREHLGAQPQVDPWRQQKKTAPDGHVIRGGSWYNFGWFCRSASRSYDEPGGRKDRIGFRLALGH